MDAQGVTVQPLVKMTGEGGFNQVIFDSTPMPADALIGAEGQGWEIAMTTLLFERGAGEGSGRERATLLMEQLKRVVSLARRTRRGGASAAADPVIRDRVASRRSTSRRRRRGWAGFEAESKDSTRSGRSPFDS
jgi:alkylation response protein AidB-like acyl-CoA dehydrogenase